MATKNKEGHSPKCPSLQEASVPPANLVNLILLPDSIRCNWHNLTPQQRGGLMVKYLYGRQHLQQLGKRGFQAMVNKHFGGNRKAATQWLSAKGLHAADKDVTYGSVFPDPGPHPAHISPQA